VQARRVELAALLDVDDPATLPDPAPLREAEAPAPLAALVARARRDRPETRYAEAARARARATAAVADASDGPLLDLGAGVMIMPHGTGLMLDVGITLPVWRGPRRARQAEAAALAAEADAAEESWRLSLLRELASALAARQAAIARRDALRDEVLPALEARRSTALAAYAAAATGASGAGASLESVAEGLREEATLRADLAAAQGEIARADVWLAHALGAHEVPWAAATRTDGGPGGAGARPHEGGARGPASSAGSREHGDAARDSEVRR
jgi:outer membrane protein TolC